MTKETFAQQLHDKASRNITLSADEQALLNAWYAEQDKAEGQMLELTHSLQSLEVIQTQIDQTLNQILETTQYIQELVIQNGALRKENTQLLEQLPQALTT
jgi:hypothetical protein